MLDQLAAERGLPLVCVQPLLVWRAREAEDRPEPDLSLALGDPHLGRPTWMLVVFCRIRCDPFVEKLRVRQRVGPEGKGHHHDGHVDT